MNNKYYTQMNKDELELFAMGFSEEERLLIIEVANKFNFDAILLGEVLYKFKK